MAGYDDRKERDDYDDDKGRDRELALQKVKGPAIGLLVSGILYVLGAFGNMVRTFLQKDELLAQFQIQNAQGGGAGPNPEMMLNIVFIVMGIFTLIGVVLGALIIFGAMKMMNLQSRGLSLTACILGMIPCSCGCLLGLPMGIWGLVTINIPEVKDLFR